MRFTIASSDKVRKITTVATLRSYLRSDWSIDINLGDMQTFD